VTLPAWESSSREEKRRFIEFIISELDADDARTMQETGSNADNVAYLENLARLHRDARKLGRSIEEPGRRGRPVQHDDDVARAKADVKRIRELFRTHYGKVKRDFSPFAEEIAGERWGLSESQIDDWVNKKPIRS
jgi:hypothetical protein